MSTVEALKAIAAGLRKSEAELSLRDKTDPVIIAYVKTAAQISDPIDVSWGTIKTVDDAASLALTSGLAPEDAALALMAAANSLVHLKQQCVQLEHKLVADAAGDGISSVF